MTPAFIVVGGSDEFSQALSHRLGVEPTSVEIRHFPDEESYVRIDGDVSDRDVILAFDFHRPDRKILSLLFLVDVLREYGVKKIGLLAPYLPYMRQDKRFRPGEAVSSKTFAQLLSNAVDWLITVDPHLHRYPNLDAIYTIPSTVVAAAPALANWLESEKEANSRPWVLVGPDRESGQWVADVADRLQAPYVIAEKRRHGDRDVKIDLPTLTDFSDHQPAIIDDIISSGTTVLTVARQIQQLKPFADQPLWCVGVHGVFTDDAYQQLQEAGLKIATSDTIPHESNCFSVAEFMAKAVDEFI